GPKLMRMLSRKPRRGYGCCLAGSPVPGVGGPKSVRVPMTASESLDTEAWGRPRTGGIGKPGFSRGVGWWRFNPRAATPASVTATAPERALCYRAPLPIAGVPRDQPFAPMTQKPRRKPQVTNRRAGNIDTHVGDRLRQRRVIRGLTLDELASKLGVSAQQLQK